MKNLRSILILVNCKTVKPALVIVVLLSLLLLILPHEGYGRIFIDIDGPWIQEIKIAIPDFKDFTASGEQTEFSTSFPNIISRDLELSGYFDPMDKGAFLDEDGPQLTPDNIRFRNWSVIGAELLLKGGYTLMGRNVEVEVRLYDVLWGRQILGKRFLGKTEDERELMHRIGNEIILAVTGYKGMFLSRLAFIDNSTGHKEMYISDFDGHNVKRITSDKSITLLPRWSPSGERILYNSYREGSPMLYMKDPSSNKDWRVSGRNGLNIGACWAPDGKKLALTLSYEDNPEIYAIDLKGNVLERYTTHWGIDVSPTFSPEGTKMAFVSDRSGSPQIYVKDLQNGNEERLTFEGNYNTSPSWSNLNKITFSGSVDGRHQIFVMDADGGKLRQLTENQGDNEDPCWSPDGRYIVFSSNRAGSYHLYIMNSNGRNQNRVSFLKGDQTSPSWSPF